VFYVGEYVWVCVGVYTKSKTSELSPLRRKLLRDLKLKFYYAKWTLRMEVVNGKNNIYYCIFRVYLVPDPLKAGSCDFNVRHG
jgi:hypothetical protein